VGAIGRPARIERAQLFHSLGIDTTMTPASPPAITAQLLASATQVGRARSGSGIDAAHAGRVRARDVEQDERRSGSAPDERRDAIARVDVHRDDVERPRGDRSWQFRIRDVEDVETATRHDEGRRAGERRLEREIRRTRSAGREAEVAGAPCGEREEEPPETARSSTLSIPAGGAIRARTWPRAGASQRGARSLTSGGR